MPPHSAESPAKKQSKWSPEEDALIIELRGSGMKWDDISKRLPGRSSISCRLHYQNYLERRSEWDEERKNKLARLYERFKPEMWAKVAEEMQVPWRAAEAMHWQLGETDMARRAGVVPFSLNMTSNEPQGPSQRLSPSRGQAHGHGHGHSQSQGSLPRDLPGIPSPRYARGLVATAMPPLIPPPAATPSGRPLSSRRESLPPRSSFVHEQAEYGYGPPPPAAYGLAPIQTAGLGPGPGQGIRGATVLPSVAELTTGVSPYSTPAYSISGAGAGGGGGAGPSSTSPVHSATASPGPLLPALSPYPPLEPPGIGKRRASPDVGGGVREPTRRRHLQPRGGAEDMVEYTPPPPLAMGPGSAPPVSTAQRGPRHGP